MSETILRTARRGGEGEGRLHAGRTALAKKPVELVEPLEFLPFRVGEGGLWSPRVDLARPPVDENPDDPLGPRREMRILRSQRIERRRREESFLVQERGEPEESGRPLRPRRSKDRRVMSGSCGVSSGNQGTGTVMSAS